MRYLRPEPRTRFGLMLGRNRAARACIDLSDGLADGIRQIADASGLGAIVEADALPLEEGSTLRDALGGGEDYELLFAVSPRMRSRLKNARRLGGDLAVTRIGRLTADRALLLSRGGSTEALPSGFEHFAPEHVGDKAPGSQMSRYFWRRVFPSMMLVAAFVLLYEATVSDSRYGSRQAELLKGTLRPIPGARLQFKATAYCKGYTTASGVAVRSGVAAADAEILPVGSVIQADFESDQYDGVYTIMDTGPEVQGNELDVYMWSCFDALRFGRQDVHLVVLRLGWNPKDTTPLMETLFHRRIPYVRPDDEPQQPPEPRQPRPERIPDGSVAPLPNPTFERPEPPRTPDE